MKRALAFLLSFVMVLSLFQTPVFALENPAKESSEPAEVQENEEEKSSEQEAAVQEAELPAVKNEPAAKVCKITACEGNPALVGVEYETVAAALTAAGTNAATIKLAANTAENVTVSNDVNGDGDTTTDDVQTIILDLNGFVLSSLTDGLSVIKNYGTLTITDSNTSGLTHYFQVDADGLWTYLGDTERSAKYTFSEAEGLKTAADAAASDEIPAEAEVIAVSGGCITGAKASKALQSYSAIDTDGTLSLQGGLLAGNSSETSGGIYGMQGRFVMTGGCIAGNAGAQLGGGFAFSLTLTGGRISYNTGLYGGLCSATSFVNIGGTVKIEHNTGSNLAVIAAPFSFCTGDDAPKDGMKIGVTLLDSSNLPVTGAFTANGAADYEKYFFADDDRFEVKFTDAVGTAGEEGYAAAHFELALKNAEWYYDHCDSDQEYVISSIDELEALAYIVNSGIDDFYDEGTDGTLGTEDDSAYTVRLSGSFKNVKADGTTAAALTTPIGNASYQFAGRFYGNGKTVELCMETAGDSGESAAYLGLFGMLKGTVLDVGTSGTVLSREYYTNAGGIAGNLSVGSSITNCFSGAEVKLERTGEAYIEAVGGLAGVSEGSVQNSYFTGSVSAELKESGESSNIDAGGLVGCNLGTLNNCYSVGTVSATGGTLYNYQAALIGLNIESSAVITNCYYKSGLSQYGVASIDQTGGELLEDETGGCYALPESQMKACTGEAESVEAGGSASWKEITIPGDTAHELGAVSMTDALNAYCKYKGTYSFSGWGVMNSRVNNAYPVFTIESMKLEGGCIYIQGEETELEGISYDPSGKTYIFENVNLPLGKSGSIKIEKSDAESQSEEPVEITILLKGENQLGVKADTERLAALLKGSSIYNTYYELADEGLYSEQIETLTLKSDAGASLTIYDLGHGIYLTKGEAVLNIGTESGEGFSGTLTVNDVGHTSAMCCLNAPVINIHS